MQEQNEMVAILTPPAVEPEPPPMNIRIMVSSLPPSVREPISSVLKPAVLGVITLKKELQMMPVVLISA